MEPIFKALQAKILENFRQDPVTFLKCMGIQGKLSRSGRQVECKCPFHSDKEPCLMTVTTHLGYWECDNELNGRTILTLTETIVTGMLLNEPFL